MWPSADSVVMRTHMPCPRHLGEVSDADCPDCRIVCTGCSAEVPLAAFPRDAHQHLGRRTKCFVCRHPAASRRVAYALFRVAARRRGVEVVANSSHDAENWPAIADGFGIPPAWVTWYGLAWRGLDCELLGVAWRFDFAEVPAASVSDEAWMLAMMDPRNVDVAVDVQTDSRDLLCEACGVLQAPSGFRLDKRSRRCKICRLCTRPAKSRAVVVKVYEAAIGRPGVRAVTWVWLEDSFGVHKSLPTVFGRAWKDLDFERMGQTWEFRWRDELGPAPLHDRSPAESAWVKKALDPGNVRVHLLV